MKWAHIITKVDEPTDCVSPLVIVRKKDGKRRICIDPKKLNQCLKREHYEMPRREDIEAELSGAMLFSRLDTNSGFHHSIKYRSIRRLLKFARSQRRSAGTAS